MRETAGQGFFDWSQGPGTNQKGLTKVMTKLKTKVERNWNGTQL